jgi:uncharacterized protein YcaQ
MIVRAAHLEPGWKPSTVAAALARELRSMASWLSLERITIEPAGNLAAALKREKSCTSPL